MKVYVDLSCDKISGQQIIQRDFRKFCKMRDILEEDITKADVLVYVQIPHDFDPIEWRVAKARGAKIVFIHHYLVKKIVNNVAIFNNLDALSIVDKHVVMCKDSYTYRKLAKIVGEEKIFVKEQATVHMFELRSKYAEFARTKSICYVGRAKKGLSKFLKASKKVPSWWIKSIFCPDVKKCKKDMSNINFIATGLSGDRLFQELRKYMFIYSPTTFRQSRMHLETSILEAICCNVIPIVDRKFRRIVPDFEKYGFVTLRQAKRLSYVEVERKRKLLHRFVIENFQERNMMFLDLITFMERGL